MTLIRSQKRKERKVNNKYINASKVHFEGKRLEAEAVLDTYFNHAVGIGEHSDLPAEINKWVEQLAAAEDAMGALERYKNK